MAGIQYNNAALIDGNGKLLRTGSSNTGGYITENQLKTWVLKDAGYTVNLELDQSTYVITPKVYNKANELIAVGQAVDLPLETMVVNATYDSTNKQITLTLKNGTTVSFSVADLISGLATQAMVTAVGQRVTTETERATAAEAALSSGKADKSNTYTKTEVDGLVEAATPSDYAQVKEKVDQNATDIVGIASDCSVIKNAIGSDYFPEEDESSLLPVSSRLDVLETENAQLKATNTAQSRRILTNEYEIKNLKAVTKGDIYTETTSSTSSGTLSLPTTYPLAPYATIDKVMGKTVVVDGELQSSRIVRVKSTSADGESSQNVTLPNLTLKGVGSIGDEYVPESGKVTRKVGVVDLGSLVWSSSKGAFTSYSLADVIMPSVDTTMLCGDYASGDALTSDKTISKSIGGKRIYLSDSAHSSAPTPTDNWLSGVYAYYPLATSTEETSTSIDHFIEVEAGGTISVESTDAQAEATITYQTDLSTT